MCKLLQCCMGRGMTFSIVPSAIPVSSGCESSESEELSSAACCPCRCNQSCRLYIVTLGRLPGCILSRHSPVLVPLQTESALRKLSEEGRSCGHAKGKLEEELWGEEGRRSSFLANCQDLLRSATLHAQACDDISACLHKVQFWVAWPRHTVGITVCRTDSVLPLNQSEAQGCPTGSALASRAETSHVR